jgi:hypothetical protein
MHARANLLLEWTKTWIDFFVVQQQVNPLAPLPHGSVRWSRLRGNWVAFCNGRSAILCVVHGG